MIIPPGWKETRVGEVRQPLPEVGRRTAGAQTQICSSSPFPASPAVWGQPEYLKSHHLITDAKVFNMKLSLLRRHPH